MPKDRLDGAETISARSLKRKRSTPKRISQPNQDRSSRPDSLPGPTRVAGIQSVREVLLSRSARVLRVWLAEWRTDRRLTELVRLARDREIRVDRSTLRELDSLRPDDSPHQGVIAEIAPIAFVELSSLVCSVEQPDSRRVLLALDQIEDPRNFGALVRCADGAGAAGVIVPHRRSAPVSAAAISASAGAMFHVPLIRVRNLADALNQLKRNGFWVVGLQAGAPSQWHDVDLDRPVVFVMGSESTGLRPRVRSVCDFLVGIAQRGQCQSLNVSVAAGIVLYEAMRQRSRTGDLHQRDQTLRGPE